MSDLENAKRMYGNKTKQNTPRFSFEGLKCWVRLLDVYDGDTVTVIMDWNNNCYQFKVRLIGVDADEMRTKDTDERKRAVEARNRLFELLTGRPYSATLLNEEMHLVWLECGDFDKYGRVLGRHLSKTHPQDMMNDNVCETLLREGHVKRLSYLSNC